MRDVGSENNFRRVAPRRSVPAMPDRPVTAGTERVPEHRPPPLPVLHRPGWRDPESPRPL